jgi:hypothetical protein
MTHVFLCSWALLWDPTGFLTVSMTRSSNATFCFHQCFWWWKYLLKWALNRMIWMNPKILGWGKEWILHCQDEVCQDFNCSLTCFICFHMFWFCRSFGKVLKFYIYIYTVGEKIWATFWQNRLFLLYQKVHANYRLGTPMVYFRGHVSWNGKGLMQ